MILIIGGLPRFGRASGSCLLASFIITPYHLYTLRNVGDDDDDDGVRASAGCDGVL